MPCDTLLPYQANKLLHATRESRAREQWRWAATMDDREIRELIEDYERYSLPRSLLTSESSSLDSSFGLVDTLD
jgi:hypothetical protein